MRVCARARARWRGERRERRELARRSSPRESTRRRGARSRVRANARCTFARPLPRREPSRYLRCPSPAPPSLCRATAGPPLSDLPPGGRFVARVAAKRYHTTRRGGEKGLAGALSVEPFERGGRRRARGAALRRTRARKLGELAPGVAHDRGASGGEVRRGRAEGKGRARPVKARARRDPSGELRADLATRGVRGGGEELEPRRGRRHGCVRVRVTAIGRREGSRRSPRAPLRGVPAAPRPLAVKPDDRRGGWGKDDTETSMLPLQAAAPCAFKDLMTRVLQFALRIAFHCVLHRRESRGIRC